MFNDTWQWAGRFRSSEKSIGVSPFNITTDLKNLLENIRYQIVNDVYSVDEIAYRFHHRLVAVHLFPNGNGRHARLITDYLLVRVGQPRFSWGRENLQSNRTTRQTYINALRSADRHDYSPLAAFVRS